MEDNDQPVEPPIYNRRTLFFAALICLIFGVLYTMSTIGPSSRKFDSPLHQACYNGDLSTATRLVSQGADINKQGLANLGDTPLNLAISAEQNKASLTKLLLDHGAKVHLANNVGRTPLHIAILFGEIGIAQMLLDHGADINAADSEGHRPLSYVGIWTKDKPMKNFLIAHGAK